MAKGKYKRKPHGQRFRINPDNLSPGLRDGFTQGMTAEQALAETPNPESRDILKGMAKAERLGRVPLSRFIGEDYDSGMGVAFSDGRVFRDMQLTFQPETIKAIQAGMICLKCLEPQPYAFADQHLPGCEGVALAGPTYMGNRQIMDFAMEFTGDKHLGPSKPISEYIEELELKAEKRRFDMKIAAGASPMKGLRAHKS